ncbi:MAG: hypothetical protein F6K22_23655 [Okeania sp. SIO2F4]|uniref:lipase family protein n=1 Tax=Okeania sp. SIO2F4 TaxID=2607790 RepID=UPI001429D644|nr:lipase family protein [Okeania sp. SIO2F4]NES05542.1 hypothetical protein [Okeania sp. SIO2F4]
MSLMNTIARFAYKKAKQDKGYSESRSADFQEYEWEQKLMCLKWLVYCISYPHFLDNDLEILQETADKIVKKMFDDTHIKKLIGEWELIWGVGVFQDEESGSDVADKTMFLAKYNGEVPGVESYKVDSYVLSIAGTNMQSNYTLLFENMGIIRTKEWHIKIEEYNNMKDSKVGEGFALGLKNLLRETEQEGNEKGIWNKIKKLIEEAEDDGKKIEITVVGHSLGGALAQLMGLKLVERINDKGWQDTCRIKVSSLGSPSPGNAQWRTYYNSAMNGQYSYPKSDITLHSWNVLDPVPLLATKEGMNKLKEMYQEPEVSNRNIDNTRLLDWLTQRVFNILKNKDYKHLIDREGFASEFNEEYALGNIINTTLENNDDDFLEEEIEEIANAFVDFFSYTLNYMVEEMEWSDIKDNLSFFFRVFGRVPFETFKAQLKYIVDPLYMDSDIRNWVQGTFKSSIKSFLFTYATTEGANFDFKQRMNKAFNHIFYKIIGLDYEGWLVELYRAMTHSYRLQTFHLTQWRPVLSLLNFSLQFVYQHTIKYVEIYGVQDFWEKYIEISEKEVDGASRSATS